MSNIRDTKTAKCTKGHERVTFPRSNWHTHINAIDTPHARNQLIAHHGTDRFQWKSMELSYNKKIRKINHDERIRYVVDVLGKSHYILTINIHWHIIICIRGMRCGLSVQIKKPNGEPEQLLWWRAYGWSWCVITLFLLFFNAAASRRLAIVLIVYILHLPSSFT